MPNPLLAEWSTPFALPPFDVISDEDFEPALMAALKESRANIAAIAENPDEPSFENTIEALELADETLGRVLSVFYNLAGTDANPKREALQRSFSPLISEYSSEITRNRALFQRVEAIWAAKDSLELTEERHRVLMLTHRSFIRAGARLEGAESDRLAEVKSRLATLGTEFTQNIVAEERSWVMDLADSDLIGLPDFLVDAATAAGSEKDRSGPVITLSRSLIVPFLQFSPRRELRERAWRAWTSRCANGGETDNRARVAETLRLRSERAHLLGYADFASFKLETEMAKEPKAAQDLLMQVWAPARESALLDAKLLRAMLQADGIDDDLQPWDWRYYSEKRRSAEHDLDESELKPYLQLDRMIEAAFACANRLFGIEARPLKDAALNHPDSRAWEILRNGEHLAVFIGDYFARSSKRSGAWCSALRSQRKLGGHVAPVVINVCNFAKPPQGRPALLSYDDARTLFHEFGHALHQMLSDVTYETISGTSVARDFVELPSQLFEHWLEVPEVLSEFATHAETGEPMPGEMLERLLAAGTYDMGFQTVEYVASALVDLDFHQGEPATDPMQRQAEVLDRIGMPSAIAMRHATPHFAHVFAGDGYSSGYYSYMWSEVMDADAFDAFREAGDPFDAGVAARLEEYVLSAGGSRDAAELYEAFRGKMPGPEALLKGRGLAA
ncbi:M3 family metallopeptidase [Boseongicola aestuarii]|uniref:Peptidyl-dipeptidase dcp n=1 Tax=Boseongicola aestuarii TaxID=1470561 RepID=A0A238J1H6_9RHOB|nr:M3 family metallopeptidase [Boseongicola aestuarii]SMX24589.1 Peptidyl-dipeptidase dcp [Boseongicola aestuarii]